MLFKIFSDKDLSTQKDLWESLLTLTKTRPLSWKIASAKKSLLKKYLAFLNLGAHGFIQTVYPCQIVLLSHIPVQDLDWEGGVSKFALDFLTAFWKGGQEFSQSSDEPILSLYFQSYFECAWYLIVKLGTLDQDDSLIKEGFLHPLMTLVDKDVLLFFWHVLFTY